jgi:hypothetical protein
MSYFLALTAIFHSDDTPLKEKVLIADHSISAKTPTDIVLVNHHGSIVSVLLKIQLLARCA